MAVPQQRGPRDRQHVARGHHHSRLRWLGAARPARLLQSSAPATQSTDPQTGRAGSRDAATLRQRRGPRPQSHGSRGRCRPPIRYRRPSSRRAARLRRRGRWIRSHPRFFLPIPVLREVFRGKFVDALKLAFQRGQLHLSGDLAPLAQPKFFAAWLRPLFRKNWVVYSKPPFGGPEYVLQYLGRYTHRVAISNHRLVSLADGQVTFRWRDSAHHNEQKLMTVSFDEFLRRFLLHLLPKGFVRIRHFGFLANRRRSTLLPLCFAALGTAPSQTEPETSTAHESDPLWRCPKCGGPMAVIERLTAAQIQLRSPPRLVTTAA